MGACSKTSALRVSTEYLFRKCPKTGGLSRYESIASKLLQLLDENEGFQVYCTGHSLVSVA